MKAHAVRIRRLASAGAIVAALGGITAAMLAASPARADVNPYDADARFISLGKHGVCNTLTYTAEGYLVDSSGNRIPDSTWHTWNGSLGGCQLENDKAVLAWKPANAAARIDVVIYTNDTDHFTQTVPGDQNYCWIVNGAGTWKENWSSEGGGGSGACTAG